MCSTATSEKIVCGWHPSDACGVMSENVSRLVCSACSEKRRGDARQVIVSERPTHKKDKQLIFRVGANQRKYYPSVKREALLRVSSDIDWFTRLRKRAIFPVLSSSWFSILFPTPAQSGTISPLIPLPRNARAKLKRT